MAADTNTLASMTNKLAMGPIDSSGDGGGRLEPHRLVVELRFDRTWAGEQAEPLRGQAGG